MFVQIYINMSANMKKPTQRFILSINFYAYYMHFTLLSFP